MNEQSSCSQSQLESALRQLTPSGGNLSAEETFYTAGWNAAHEARGSQRRSYETRGFAMGVVCSLACCAVGMQLLPVAEISEKPQIAGSTTPKLDAQTETVAVEVETKGIDRVVSPIRTGGLDEVFALLSPADWFAVQQDGRLQKSRTFSQAAVMGIDANSLWNMASIEQGRIEVPHAVTSENLDTGSSESLRAFPVSPDVFDEWL